MTLENCCICHLSSRNFTLIALTDHDANADVQNTDVNTDVQMCAKINTGANADVSEDVMVHRSKQTQTIS